MKWLPVQIAAWIVALPYIVVGKVLSLPMAAIGMATGWPKVCWPWDAKTSPTDPTPEAWWWKSGHWSLKLGRAFSEWWWRSVRNGFSNGARYALRSCRPEDLVSHVTPGSVHYKGPIEKSYPRWDNPPNYVVRYQYDKSRPWLARYTYTRFGISGGRYFLFYVGFKVDRTNGMGYSLRIGVFRDEV